MSWSPNDNTIEHWARLGYGARGGVYCLVGLLALLASLGRSPRNSDSHGALSLVLQGPLGPGLVGLVALGLVGFALWRVVEAITDADRRGRGGKALLVRAAHLVSAGVYAGLAATAASLAVGLGLSEDDKVRDSTAWLMQQPFGPWLVGLAGLAMIGTGIGYGGKAWTGDVAKRLALPEGTLGWVCPVGRFGYAARGLSFWLIGGFLLVAAWKQASSEAKGLSDAFEALREQPFGGVLVACVGLGYFAFGAFGLIQARYRRIEAPDIAVADEALSDAVDAVRGEDATRRAGSSR